MYNVDAYLGPIKIPINIVHEDQRHACKWLVVGSCPLEKGAVITHKVKWSVGVPIQAVVDMEFYIRSRNLKPSFCYRSTFQINSKGL